MSKLSNLEFFKLVAGNGDAGPAESRFIYPPAIAKTPGFKLLEVAPGTATMEIVADTDKHANPMGTIHGGVLCDIADAVLGRLMRQVWKRARVFTSLDLEINFFRPVWNGRIRAVAKPVNVGRKISRYVCDILRDDEKLVAQVTSTVMTLRGDQASGR